MLQHNAACIGHLDSFGALGLVFEGQDGFILAGSPEGNIFLGVEPQGVTQVNFTGREFDHFAVFSENELCLYLFFDVRLGHQYCSCRQPERQQKQLF